MQQSTALMESQLSLLSSLNGEPRTEDYIQPHYKESYRLAIDGLVSRGKDAYQEILKAEQIGEFLSQEEIHFIQENTKQPVTTSNCEESNGSPDNASSSGTYWPTHSDVETPDLDIGWPEFLHQNLHTNINLLFHPPRLNSPTIKEVIRKHIQEARQVIAVVMDIFTDVDIFKEIVDASLKGVPVYVLLDESRFESFLTMAENQGVQIQRLRNMRVRTVRGQDYLCRSGAKFHGVMDQKFLLVDCQTVLYGSYSFTWSFEKINLSMVQVITGQLVESYDEEFRTLFARSTVPVALAPPEGKHNGHNLKAGFKVQCGEAFERSDQLRHTLDSVYLRACGRPGGGKIPTVDLEIEPYDGEPFNYRPAFEHGSNMRSRANYLQPADALGYLKRHSYAGERPESSFTPSHSKYGASNWNVSGNGGTRYGTPGRNDHLSGGTADTLQSSRLGQAYGRGANIRQSFHGNDKHSVSMQQNLPSLERTTKSFLRTWRIESYLNNNEVPIGDSSDYLDQYEGLDCKSNSYMHSRLRSSLIFKSTIPEQPETNSYTQNSSSDTLTNMPVYTSMQWNPAASMESKRRQEEFMLKRRSLQILDDPRNSINYSQGRDPYHSMYASLGRAKGSLSVKTPVALQEDKYKRHSVADPRTNMQYIAGEEPSRNSYGNLGYGQAERRALDEISTTGQDPQNLKEDKRSVSHYDVKKVTEGKNHPASMWQEPPSRTVSVLALGENTKEPAHKSLNMGSPRFLKKSSKKIKSLLNIPEKNKIRSDHKVDSSSDIVLSEDQEPTRENKVYSGTVTSGDSASHLSVNENHFGNNAGKSSAPRFSTEDLQPNLAVPGQGQHSIGIRKDRSSSAIESRHRSDREENRLYSRFEPFCTTERKQSPSRHSQHTTAKAQCAERSKTVLSNNTRGPSPGELHNHTGCSTQSHNENKLGRFIQRLINKHK